VLWNVSSLESVEETRKIRLAAADRARVRALAGTVFIGDMEVEV